MLIFSHICGITAKISQYCYTDLSFKKYYIRDFLKTVNPFSEYKINIRA